MSLQTRLSALITAIGADIKSLRTDVAAIQGGAATWSEERRGTIYTNTTVTASDVYTGFTPQPNTRYLIEARLWAYSAATATGIQVALAGPTTGITSAGVKVSSPLTATTDNLFNGALNTFTAPATSLTTPQLIQVDAFMEVGASPGAGAVRIQARSEVAGSAINIRTGSPMRWRTLAL